MSKDEKERIGRMEQEMQERYGPVMTRRELADLLKMHPNSADKWAAARGLTARRVSAGRYASRDVATALVLGCCL